MRLQIISAFVILFSINILIASQHKQDNHDLFVEYEKISTDNVEKLALLHEFAFTKGNWVESISINATDQIIAVGLRDGQIVLINTSRMAQVESFQAHDFSVSGLAFNPEKPNILASASTDNTIKIWDLDNPISLLHPFEGGDGGFLSIDFDPSGERLVSTSGELLGVDNVVRVWDIQKLELYNTFTGHNSEVDSADFSPDGQQIVSGGYGLLKLWSVRDKKQLESIDTFDAWVYDVEFSPDGKTIAAGGGNGVLLLLDSQTYERMVDATVHDPGTDLYSITFDQTGDLLFIGDANGVTYAWNMKNKEEVHLWQAHKRKHAITSVEVSHNNKFVVTGSTDATVKIWGIKTPQ